MSGLIQRLLDRTGGAPAALPAQGLAVPTPLARSASPLAALDQRLHDPAFRDLAVGLPLPDGPGPEGLDLPQDTGPAIDPAEPRSTPSMPSEPPPVRPDPAPRAEAHPRSADLPSMPAFVEIPDPIAALRAAARENSETDLRPVRPAPAQPVLPIEPVRTPPETFRPPEPPTPEFRAAPPLEAPRQPLRPQLPGEFRTAPAPRPADPGAPPRVEPHAPQPAVPETVSETVPAPAATLEPPAPPQMLQPIPRPAAPEPAQSDDDGPAPDASPAVRSVERIVERVLERTPPPASRPATERINQRPTAESVSKIGPLPQRRSAHTLFGLRRL